MKEKVERIIRRSIRFIKKGSKKEKIKICIAVLLLGVVFCITGKSLSVDKKQQGNSHVRQVDVNKEVDVRTNDDLEKRLEEIVGTISGVGKVKVLITYEDEGERIPMENINEKTSVNNESGDSEKSIEKDIVLEDAEDGESVALRKKTYPAVRGVIVVAEGAGDITVKSELISAIAAVTGVSQYRIHVMSM